MVRIRVILVIYQGINTSFSTSTSSATGIQSVQLPACLSVYPNKPVSVLSGVQRSLTNTWGRLGHHTGSYSNRQVANLNIITALFAV